MKGLRSKKVKSETVDYSVHIFSSSLSRSYSRIFRNTSKKCQLCGFDHLVSKVLISDDNYITHISFTKAFQYFTFVY